ncbi:MAG TPA: CBS domain-containing protein, partial [Acidimicrobiia bacterium]|nr:CBS domain-containing protein [Acidimicrobiia bacterium]
MSQPVRTVRPETPFKDVVDCLVRSEVSSVPVVDDGGRVVGIVTEADLVSKEAYDGHRPRALTLLADLLSGREHHWATKAAGFVAADVMTRGVVACGPDEEVRVVARRMLQRGVKRMPVVDGDELVGIVTRRDILRTFSRSDDDIAADVALVLVSHPPEDHHVECSVTDGVVTLTGDIRYPSDEPIVVGLVRAVDGVVDVIARLRPREPEPPTPSSAWTY